MGYQLTNGFSCITHCWYAYEQNSIVSSVGVQPNVRSLLVMPFKKRNSHSFPSCRHDTWPSQWQVHLTSLQPSRPNVSPTSYNMSLTQHPSAASLCRLFSNDFSSCLSPVTAGLNEPSTKDKLYVCVYVQIKDFSAGLERAGWGWMVRSKWTCLNISEYRWILAGRAGRAGGGGALYTCVARDQCHGPCMMRGRGGISRWTNMNRSRYW